MYASKSILEHLLRGGLSVLLLWASVRYSHQAPWGLLVAFPLSLFLWRGCPKCWLIGLFQTVQAVLQGRAVPEDACLTGSCAVRPKAARRPPGG